MYDYLVYNSFLFTNPRKEYTCRSSNATIKCILPNLAGPIPIEYRIKNSLKRKTEATRNRKFNSRSLFLSVVKLHDHQSTGCAEDAMADVFSGDAPTGSALTQMRELVSWKFFQNAFQQSVKAFCKKLRPTWKGFYISAVDGDQYVLPRNDSTLAAGYRGQSCGLNLETYGMKMYVALGNDVITGTPLALVPSETANELKCGINVTREIHRYQANNCRGKTDLAHQLYLYDRLYLCRELLELHDELGTSFVARCKKGGTFIEVVNFWNSDELERICEIDGHTIRLVKAVHNNEVLVYATNIMADKLSVEQVDWLYFRRWEIETTNAHGAKTLVIEKFHSHKANGILQEIFACFWSLLLSKCAAGNFKEMSEEFGGKIYHRANLKRVRKLLMENIRQVFSRLTKKLCEAIEALVDSTMRKRERLSRTAPRMRRYRHQKKYNSAKPALKA